MEPYLGEIRTVGFNFAPEGWALCSGQIIPVAQNAALFSILGTTYGGNGSSTFALPNLNGAIPIGQGQGPGLSDRVLGELGGTTTVTLLGSEIPSHTHSVNAVTAAGDSGDPTGRIWAQQRYGRGTRKAFATTADTQMAPDTLAPSGGTAAHNNMPPFLGMYYIIALSGVYPARP